MMSRMLVGNAVALADVPSDGTYALLGGLELTRVD